MSQVSIYYITIHEHNDEILLFIKDWQQYTTLRHLFRWISDWIIWESNPIRSVTIAKAPGLWRSTIVNALARDFTWRVWELTVTGSRDSRASVLLFISATRFFSGGWNPIRHPLFVTAAPPTWHTKKICHLSGKWRHRLEKKTSQVDYFFRIIDIMTHFYKRLFFKKFIINTYEERNSLCVGQV